MQYEKKNMTKLFHNEQVSKSFSKPNNSYGAVKIVMLSYFLKRIFVSILHHNHEFKRIHGVL